MAKCEELTGPVFRSGKEKHIAADGEWGAPERNKQVIEDF